MGAIGGASLKLLADPTRARILEYIIESGDGRELVGRLAERLNLRQPTVSHHMRALLDAGLVDRHPEGRQVWYSVAPDHVDAVTDLLRVAPDDGMSPGVLDRVISDLAARFAGTFSPETVDAYVRESYSLLSHDARITQYLPSLTARFAADRLSALARDRAQERASGIPEVLFVCVHNAGRSQIAAAILQQLAGDRVRVRSAGSAPAASIRSTVMTALDEIGVSLRGEFPKPLTDEVVRAADVVVTMGCGDACPIYPGRQYLDWSIRDPAGQPLAVVREIRDDIESRVRALLTSLLADRSGIAHP